MNTKISGFSLIEVLVVMVIIITLASFGFNSYQNSKIKTEVRLDQQYLLQLPALVENYFADHLEYPDDLNDFLSPHNGLFLTPKRHYSITYSLINDDYLFIAIARSSSSNINLETCSKLSIHSSGQLEAVDESNNDTSDKCWD